MNRKFAFILLTILITGLIIVGCSSEDDPVSPDEYTVENDDYFDVAEDMAATLASPDEGMLGLWRDMDNFTNPPMGQNGKSFEKDVMDTTFVRGPFTVTIDLTFYDADGNPSEMYDSLTTVRMTAEHQMEGTLQGLRRSMTIEHESSDELDGIAPDDTICTLNSQAVRRVSGSFMPLWRLQERDWSASHHINVEDLSWHDNEVDYPYPLEGVIDAETNFEREVTGFGAIRTYQVTVASTTTFDGTRYAMIEIDNGPTFWIDLDTGEAYRERPDDDN